MKELEFVFACYICNGKGTWTTYSTETGEELLRPLESECPDCFGTGLEPRRVIEDLRGQIEI
jgi:hypothetical protein